MFQEHSDHTGLIRAMSKIAAPVAAPPETPKGLIDPYLQDEDYYEHIPEPHETHEKKVTPKPQGKKTPEEREISKDIPKLTEKTMLDPKHLTKKDMEQQEREKEQNEFEEKFPHEKLRGPLKPTGPAPKMEEPKTKEKAPASNKMTPESNPAMFRRINAPVKTEEPKSKTQPSGKQVQPKSKGKNSGGWQKGPKGGEFKIGPGGHKEYRQGSLESAYASLEVEAGELTVGDHVKYEGDTDEFPELSEQEVRGTGVITKLYQGPFGPDATIRNDKSGMLVDIPVSDMIKIGSVTMSSIDRKSEEIGCVVKKAHDECPKCGYLAQDGGLVDGCPECKKGNQKLARFITRNEIMEYAEKAKCECSCHDSGRGYGMQCDECINDKAPCVTVKASYADSFITRLKEALAFQVGDKVELQDGGKGEVIDIDESNGEINVKDENGIPGWVETKRVKMAIIRADKGQYSLYSHKGKHLYGPASKEKCEEREKQVNYFKHKGSEKVAAIESIDEAKNKIERAIDSNGEFTHNIIGMTLRQVSDKFGKAEANKLVDTYDLTKLFGIRKASRFDKIAEDNIANTKERDEWIRHHNRCNQCEHATPDGMFRTMCDEGERLWNICKDSEQILDIKREKVASKAYYACPECGAEFKGKLAERLGPDGIEHCPKCGADIDEGHFGVDVKTGSINDRNGIAIEVGDHIVDTAFQQGGEGIVTSVKLSDRDGQGIVFYKNDVLGGKSDMAYSKDCAVSKRANRIVVSEGHQSFMCAMKLNKESANNWQAGQRVTVTSDDPKMKNFKGHRGVIYEELNDDMYSVRLDIGNTIVFPKSMLGIGG